MRIEGHNAVYRFRTAINLERLNVSALVMSACDDAPFQDVFEEHAVYGILKFKFKNPVSFLGYYAGYAIR